MKHTNERFSFSLCEWRYIRKHMHVHIAIVLIARLSFPFSTRPQSDMLFLALYRLSGFNLASH